MPIPSADCVLVVARSEFDRLGGQPGFMSAEVAEPILSALLWGPATFKPRDEVETDEAWLQVIPYVVLRWNGRIFAYDRGRSGGESRLHKRWSIGIGGHLEPRDAYDVLDDLPETSADVIVDAGMWREVDEEMGYEPDGVLTLLGLIFDDSDAVGRVHLGICYTLDLTSSPLVPIDSTRLVRRMVWAEIDVRDPSVPYESWSRLAMEHLASRPAAGNPAKT